MSDLKYLCKLIEMIDTDGNDNSRRRLWSLVGVLAKKQVGELSKRESHDVLAEMHELNIEQLIKVQAKSFYEEFPLLEVKEQLIQDFIEMEHCRRRDDFEGFSLAAFQQVESITNYAISNTDIWEKTQLNKSTLMFTSKNKEGELKRFGFPLVNQIVYAKESEREKLVAAFFAKAKESLEFVQKFKLVLYFGYFNEYVRSYDEWSQVFELGYKLYLSRNSNHRGSVSTETQSKNKEDLAKYKYRYYLLFLGFVGDFIHRISLTYENKIVDIKDPIKASA